MQKQSSAGIVIYKESEGRARTYLLLQYPGRYWDFPKGKLEFSESWQQAALREAKEETGLKIDLNSNFKHVYNYSFNDFKGTKIEKTVMFFIGKASNNDHVTLSYEHIDYLWLSYKEARVQIHFENVRKLLDEVEHFLQNEEKKCL